ncbi:hypothetical protein Mapa_008982 [Marchantia paleacea]|nr:hypothetical protein Mapa_008982 [Marchantia paleacea]
MRRIGVFALSSADNWWTLSLMDLNARTYYSCPCPCLRKAVAARGPHQPPMQHNQCQRQLKSLHFDRSEAGPSQDPVNREIRSDLRIAADDYRITVIHTEIIIALLRRQ